MSKIKSILGVSASLAKAGFKLRNEGSFIGIFWYLLEPLLMFMILINLQGVMNTRIEMYPIYLFLGLIMFNFFANSTSQAITMLSSKAKFIKSMRIPHESLVISGMLQTTFSHIFEIILLGLIILWYGAPIIGIIFYPLVFILLFIFSLGVSLILATLGVFISDMNNVWRVLTRLLWFATPIFYLAKENTIADKIISLNPLYYFISIGRDFVIYQVFNLLFIIICILLGFSAIILGLWIFEKYKNKFAETI
jgi:ABC-type polysaccharide/polyol phosphate export permease